MYSGGEHFMQVCAMKKYIVALVCFMQLSSVITAYGTLIIDDESGIVREYSSEEGAYYTPPPIAEYPYVVRDIAVKHIGKEGVDSREFAMTEAYRIAYEKLIDRIVVLQQKGAVPQIDDTEIRRMVKGVKVVWDRVTSKSYCGILDVYFDKEVINVKLNSLGVQYAGRLSRNAVVIPLMHTNGMYTGYRGTPIYESISKLPTIGVLKFRILKNGFKDLKVPNHDTIMIAPFSRFKDVIRRNDASELIAILAENVGRNLEVNVRIMNSDGSDMLKFVEYSRFDDESDEDFWDRAMKDLFTKIDALWKGVDYFKAYGKYQSSFIISIKNKKDLDLVRRRLSKIPEIISYRENAIKNRDLLRIRIGYKCIPAALSSLLSRQGLDIYHQAGGIYIRPL